ncbi:toxin [Actinomyces sp. B33]|uniref:toxin n=1 Tax=Actinomyces sp. B33 TaxID=2942131 RepID=UPI002341BBDE|nr:toxin [Actinomyces sp. B33]MDC4232178.1 toxin [Actinomyces sp. B33]
MTDEGRSRRRRIAVHVSEVDRRLIERGIAPSWEDRVGPGDRRPGAMADSPDRGDGANDRRLVENVPPHAQPRA